jgi:two-component system cell cycle response regulator CtrA
VRILLIEPDPAVAASIELLLKSERFNVYTTTDPDEAVELGQLYDYDAIVLADVTGAHSVLQQLRQAKVKAAILRLSALAGVTDVVAALDAGADDHMVTPFQHDELVARLCAIVRRSKGHAESIITTGNLSLNLHAHTAHVDGVQVHFTGKEYAMLELLSLRKGTTISKEMFLNHLYGGRDEPEIKIIDVFICKIRKKLREFGGHELETVWGRGYVLRDPVRVANSPSMVPELQELVDEDRVGFIPMPSWGQQRARDARRMKIKSPTLVPEQGQK